MACAKRLAIMQLTNLAIALSALVLCVLWRATRTVKDGTGIRDARATSWSNWT